MKKHDLKLQEAIIEGMCRSERVYGEYNDKEAFDIFCDTLSEYGYKIVKDNKE